MTTVYVAQPQTELKVHSRQLQIYQQQRFSFAVPLDRVNQVIILGAQPWAQKAVNLALSLNIPVLYFEPSGHCIEYLKHPQDAARYLRVQLERSQDLLLLRNTAESLVRARLHNALVLNLLTTSQIVPSDFTWVGQGIFLRPAALDTFIQQWDQHLASSIQHPFAGETTHRHCIELQAQEYIATLLGDQEQYRPLVLMRS